MVHFHGGNTIFFHAFGDDTGFLGGSSQLVLFDYNLHLAYPYPYQNNILGIPLVKAT